MIPIWLLSCIITLSSHLTNPSLHFVSPAGHDLQEIDGIERPWRSIGYALSRLPEAGGVLIQAASGEYPAVSTTRRFKNPVIIRSSESHRTIILPGTGGGAFVLNGADNLILEGLTIDNRNNEAVSNALHILGGSSRIIIRHCLISHGDSGYINADAVKIHLYSNRILFEDNIVTNANDELLEISGMPHDIILRRNVFLQDSPNGSKPLLGIYDAARRIAIEDNLFVIRSAKTHPSAIQLGHLLAGPLDIRDIAIANNLFFLNPPGGIVSGKGAENLLLAGNGYTGATFFNFDFRGNKPIKETDNQKIEAISYFDSGSPSSSWMEEFQSIRKSIGLSLFNLLDWKSIPDSMRLLV